MYDVIVIGCGASGSLSAIFAARRGLSVAIVEAESRGFKKLLRTGNGRCNLTNKNISTDFYNKRAKALFTNVYEGFNNLKTLDFFKKIGVESVELDDGKIYPISLKAASLVNNLLDELNRLNISIINDFPVDKISKSKNFEIFSKEKKLSARSIIFACGSKSNIKEKYFNSAYKALDLFNLKKISLSQSLVPLKSDYPYLKHINGCKFKTEAKLKKSGKEIKSFYGEVLFTEYGVSGIPIMNLSRYICESDMKDYTLCVDLLPMLDFNEVFELLKARRESIGYKTLDKFFIGLIPKQIILPLVKDNVLNMNDIGESITDKSLKKISAYLKSFAINITGLMPFIRSQVMVGGISVHELNDNLSLKKEKDVFCIGELVDVDGLCGGYNLQWAWSSAYTAGMSVLSGEQANF